MIEKSRDTNTKQNQARATHPGSSLMISNLTGAVPVYDFSSKSSTQRECNKRKVKETSNFKVSGDAEWANNSDDSVLLSLLKDGIKGS